MTGLEPATSCPCAQSSRATICATFRCMNQVGLEPTKFPSERDNPCDITCAPVVSVVIVVASDAKPPASGSCLFPDKIDAIYCIGVCIVGTARLELATPCSQNRCASTCATFRVAGVLLGPRSPLLIGRGAHRMRPTIRKVIPNRSATSLVRGGMWWRDAV